MRANMEIGMRTTSGEIGQQSAVYSLTSEPPHTPILHFLLLTFPHCARLSQQDGRDVALIAVSRP